MEVLALVPDASHGFTVTCDGRSAAEIIPYRQRVALWKKANENLERDVNTTAGLFTDFELGAFLWCFTWEHHRHDGLVGTIYFYYLVELIAALSETHSPRVLEIHRSVPSAFARMARRRSGLLSRRTGNRATSFVRTRSRRYFAPLRLFGPFLRHRLTKPRMRYEQGKIWLQMRDDFAKNRFGAVLDFIAAPDVQVYHKFIFANPASHPFGNKEVHFSDFLTLGRLLKSARSVIRIRRETARVRRLNRPAWSDNFFWQLTHGQSFTETFHMVLRSELLEAAMLAYQPRALFTVTSLADPISRLPLSIASRQGIPGYVVACRSMLSVYRAEDRSCEADRAKQNGTSMGDFFIVRDAFSYQTLVRQQIHPSAISISGGTRKTLTEPPFVLRNGIVLLLTQFENNQRLIEHLRQCNTSAFTTIYLRSHPNRWKKNEVSENQMELLRATGLEIVDITDLPMHRLECVDTIAMTTNSTAGVEIVSRGIPIVWVPFITEHSLQFAEVMENLGHICYDGEAMVALFDRFAVSPEHIRTFTRETSDRYSDFFKADDTISDLLHSFTQSGA